MQPHIIQTQSNCQQPSNPVNSRGLYTHYKDSLLNTVYTLASRLQNVSWIFLHSESQRPPLSQRWKKNIIEQTFTRDSMITAVISMRSIVSIYIIYGIFAYICLIFYGKCRQIHHTWILWQTFPKHPFHGLISSHFV